MFVIHTGKKKSVNHNCLVFSINLTSNYSWMSSESIPHAHVYKAARVPATGAGLQGSACLCQN